MHFFEDIRQPSNGEADWPDVRNLKLRARNGVTDLVFASTRQRSVLFHKVPLNELENSSNTTKRLLTSCY